MRRRSLIGGAFTTLGISGSLFLPLLTSTASAKTTTPLQKGIAFFKGQTLRIIAGSVGGSDDTAARALAPAIQSYLHLGAVDVVDVPGGAGAPAQDMEEAANPNGLTISFLLPETDEIAQITNTPFLNFNPEHVAFISSTAPSAGILVGSTSTRYTSIAAIKAATSPVTCLEEGTSTFIDEIKLLSDALELPQLQILTGYSSTGLVVAGFLRGDGPTTFGSLPQDAPLVTGGKADVIATTNHVPVGTTARGSVNAAPTIASLLAKIPNRTKTQIKQDTAIDAIFASNSEPMYVNQAVPADHLLALRAAVEYAYKQGSVQQGLLNTGNPDIWESPEVDKQLYITALKDGPSLLPLLNG